MCVLDNAPSSLAPSLAERPLQEVGDAKRFRSVLKVVPVQLAFLNQDDPDGVAPRPVRDFVP